MAYRDPYSQQPSRSRSRSQNHYDDATQEYNPYSLTQEPHETYDRGGIGPSSDHYGSGYTDEPQYDMEYPPRRGASQRAFAGAPLNMQDNRGLVDSVPSKEHASDTGGADGFSPTLGERSARNLRNYRYIHQGQLWTKGGRGRCIGRFCCCTLMIAALLFISIVLALALWIRPPNISVGGVDTMTVGGSAIQLQENGISVNLGVNISVANPNYFSVNFKQIKAEIFYPINNTKIGEGTSNNIMFDSHSQTNFTFPFSINYKTDLDPQSRIIADLAQKCGVGGSKTNISINYKITLGIRILLITISPVVSNHLSFMCPIDASDIEALIKSTGLNVGGLLGGGS